MIGTSFHNDRQKLTKINVNNTVEYKRRLPPRGIFWIVVIQLTKCLLFPPWFWVANCDDLGTQYGKATRAWKMYNCI